MDYKKKPCFGGYDCQDYKEGCEDTCKYYGTNPEAEDFAPEPVHL